MEPTDPQTACFEAGVKFGSLYHQFAGTPVSPESAPSLARAMEESIENQPHCESVTVDVLEAELAAACDGAPASDGEREQGDDSGRAQEERSPAEGEEATGHGYVELTGRFVEVEVVVEYEGVEVVAEMAMEDDYPLMELQTVRTP